MTVDQLHVLAPRGEVYELQATTRHLVLVDRREDAEPLAHALHGLGIGGVVVRVYDPQTVTIFDLGAPTL